MSGSVRSTTTAVLHSGNRYAPDAPHQPRSQSQWLAGVMVDSEMRSLEGTWSGMSAEARKTWRSSALRRVVYDGRPLNAAAGAVMRRHTWKEYGDPPLSFAEFIRAHPQGCFVCYGRNKGFNHDHRACPIHKAHREAYKKVHGSKKRAPAGIRETKVEVTKDELSKLMSSGTELAKEIQEIKRSWVPKSDDKNKENKENDKNKDKDKKGKKWGKKKSVNEVDAEGSTPTTTTDAA